MGCNNYSHKHFNFVESRRKQSTLDEFKSFLDGFYKPEDVKEILDAIEEDIWNSEFKKPFIPTADASLIVKSMDDDGFLLEQSSSSNIMPLYQDPIYGGSIAMANTISEFEEEIIKLLIYDKEKKKGIDSSIILPNGMTAVSYKLLGFKKQLLQKIWDVTGINRTGNFNSDIELTKIIQETLKDFEFLLMSRSEKYLNVYKEYVKLKAFDSLIKNLDFISIKPAYRNGRFIGSNMYDYIGPQMKRDASIGKETAEISDYTGSIMKLLLQNCFRREVKVNGEWKEKGYITEVSFNRAMTEVIKWYTYGEGRIIDPENYKKLVSLDSELDYGSLIDTYLDNNKRKSSYQLTINSILNGARRQIFSRDSGLTSFIRGCFERHMMDVFSQVYLQYERDPETNALINKETTDYFIELQANNIQNIVRIQSEIWKPHLKRIGDPEINSIFTDVLKEHQITIDPEAKTISIYGDVYQLTANATKNENVAGYIYDIQLQQSRSESTITDEQTIALIRDVLGIEITSDYKEILEGLAPDRSLMSFFDQAIVLVLASASDKFDFIKYDKSNLLNTSYYKDKLNPIAQYLSEVYGEDSINVIRNNEGNALPLYSLGSLSKKLKRVVHRLKTSTVAQYNPIVEQPGLLMREYIRSQVEINGTIKASKELGPSEIMSVQMLNDFWINLNRESVNPTVKLMPMTLSDKSTHTLYEINLNSYMINGKGLGQILKDIGLYGHTKEMDYVKKSLVNDFSEREGLKIKQQLIHILTQYANVYSFSFDKSLAEEDLGYLKTRINIVQDILKTKKNIDEVKNDFGKNRFVDLLYCDTNYLGELSINPQLLFEADLHLFKTESFDEIIRDNMIDFIEDMRTSRFKINAVLYKDVPAINDKWYDPISRIIEPFLIFDENGEIVDDHTQKIDWSKCTFKIHPVLESYFYANLLINVPLQEVMLGTTYTYKGFLPQFRDNKQLVIDNLNVVSQWAGESELTLDSSYAEILKREQSLLPTINDILNSNDDRKKEIITELVENNNKGYQFKIHKLLELNKNNNQPEYDRLDKIGFYKQTMSLKLNDKMKRALIVGATITSPVLDKPYCPTRYVNIAIGKDFYGFAFNLSGDSSNKEPHDGSGTVHPVFSRAVNFGLFDAAVGSNKKTIAGEIDPETLVFREIKWAEFELSNQYRKRSFDESEMSAEIMYQKMSDEQIPIANLTMLDISHFYGKQIHKSKFYNMDITHSKDIYFFDPKTAKYYKIIDVTSNKNSCDRKIIEVDKFGNERGNVIPQTLPMNTVYDLDQIFGGCFCKEMSDDGVLIDSEVNNDIVFKIVSENEWFDYITHVYANTSAFKTGAENVNTISTSKISKYNNIRSGVFSRGNTTRLKTIKYDLSNYGAIMNGEYELDSDHSVKEMGQVMAALIQEGASIETVNEIYKAIGELAYMSISEFIEAHRQFLNGDKEKLVLELGKAVIDAFDVRYQGNVALAYAFLDTFSQNINMPFSSHAVSGVVLSALGSKLTKLSLKTTYSGLGTIQVPSNGIMKYFDYNGKHYDYEGLVVALNRRGISSDAIYDVGEFQENIEELPTGEKIITIVPTNKTLREIKFPKTNIDFEDTIVIYDTVTKQSEVIKVSDVSTRDYYRNRYNWTNKLAYKWSVKSRDLLPQITRYEYQGQTYTAWDLSAYRAMAYASSLLKPKDFEASDLENMKQWLLTYAPELKFENNPNLEEDLKQFIKQQKKLFKEVLHELSEIKNGVRTSLTKDPFFTDKITNVKTSAGQIILGKRFMKEFGLRKGDNLADINSYHFFMDRLTQQYALPTEDEVSKEYYDAVLYTKDGEKILVVLSDLDDTRLAGTTPYTGNVLSVRGNGVWYKDEEELKLSKDINIRSKVINGQEHIVLAVKDFKDIESLQSSSMTSMLRFNYKPSNVKELAAYELDFDWDNSEEIVHFSENALRTIGLEGKVLTVEHLKQLSDVELSTILTHIEKDRIKAQLKSLSIARFESFKKSLEAIGARIPAQSMQSFMSLEIVGFTESDVNDIYVPFTLTWVAGSDYDIDKVYVMQYSISGDGILYTNTNLRGFSVDDLLKFSLPKNRHFEITPFNGYYVSAEDVNRILSNDAEPLLRILKQTNTNITFDPTVEEWQAKKIKKLLNKHESFKPSEKHKQEALKNFIVNKVVSVIQDPKNQINVLTPVHTKKIKAGAKGSELGEREKHLSLLTPTTTMIMQDQNMLGKTSIASSATGEKVYFHVLNSYSEIILKLRDIVYDDSIPAEDKFSTIINNLSQLAIKSPFFNEYGEQPLSLIGNSSLKPLIRALEFKELDIYARTLPKIKEGIFKDKFVNDDGTTFDLIKLLYYLHDNSNRTNCSEDMSEVITTSTDNAKELDLKKINAIPETLDIFTYLISIGTDLSDVLKFTKNPAFKVCVDFAKSSVFMPGVFSWNTFEQVVKFVRNKDVLWGPEQYLFKDEICNVRDFWVEYLNDHIDKDTYNNIKTTLRILGANIDEMNNPRDYFTKFMKMFEISIPNVNLSKMFLEYIKSKMSLIKKDLNRSEDVEQLIQMLLESGEELNIPGKEALLEQLKKYVDLYTYFKYTVIPKTNSIKSVLNNVRKDEYEIWEDYSKRYFKEYKNRIDTILNILENDILPGVREQKILGAIFSINKGLATGDFDEYEWIAKINERINKIIFDYSEKHNDETLKAFDLITFIKNETYRNDQIEQMEKMKHTYNVLQVLVNAEHTWNRVKSVAVLRDVVSTIGIFDFERNIVKQALKQNTENITKNHTTRVRPDEWTNVRAYARNVFVWNWFARQDNLKFRLLPGQLGFTSKTNKEPLKLINGRDCVLNNEVDIANFKWFVETELITWLKRNPKYKDNQFIQKLIQGGFTDKSKNLISYLKFSFELQNAQKHSTYSTMYSQILNDFNKIMFDEIDLPNFKVNQNGELVDSHWTIGDVFFVYNLYVNKESAGKDSMLKLFEDNVLYGNQLKTARSYYDYLSAIDKWGISMDGPKEGKIELDYHVNDLIYAMRYSGESRAKVYGANTLTPDNVSITGGPRRTVTQSSSYFLFNFPYLLNELQPRNSRLAAPITIDVKDLRSNYTTNLEDKSTIRTIVEHMSRLFGNGSNVPIKVVDEFEIKHLFQDEDVSNLCNQNGFIKNGIVYINLDKATLDTPIHELAHLICAGMKFSLSSSVRNTYYRLLKAVSDNQESFSDYLDDMDPKQYENKVLSDFREEMLVRILSGHLKHAFESKWPDAFDKQQLTPNDLTTAIVKTLHTILKVTNVPGEVAGAFTLEAILKFFNSKLFDLSGGWLSSGIVINSQRVTTIKNKLKELNQLDIKGDC